MAYASINWLEELPQQFLINGFDESPQDFKVRTDMDAAIAKQRPRFSAATYKFSGMMLMTNTQYELFVSFYRDTLAVGSLEFNMQKRGFPDIIQVVRFTDEGYQSSPHGRFWDVKLNLEVIP